MTWVDRAAPIVGAVIRRVGRKDLKVLRKALADAYPWGVRANAPYKAWLAETRRQLGHPLNATKADAANTQTELFSQR